MKLKRRIVEQHFADEIEKLYAAEKDLGVQRRAPSRRTGNDRPAVRS